VVAPPDEVREYIDTIMDKATRAEYVLLAMRLPKEAEAPPPAKEPVPAEDHIITDGQVLWATTNSTPTNPE
jgi:hypothetical protein